MATRRNETPEPDAPLFVVQPKSAVISVRGRPPIEIPGFVEALNALEPGEEILFPCENSDDKAWKQNYGVLRGIITRAFGTGDDNPFKITRHPKGARILLKDGYGEAEDEGENAADETDGNEEPASE